MGSEIVDRDWARDAGRRQNPLRGGGQKWQNDPMRYAMKRGALKPLLLLLGATAETSFVDVDEHDVTFRFGSFEERIPRDMIVSAERARWPAWAGIGWRIGPSRTLGLIGALDGTVRVSLNTRVKSRIMVFPVSFESVVVSLEDPDGFVEDLTTAGA